MQAFSFSDQCFLPLYQSFLLQKSEQIPFTMDAGIILSHNSYCYTSEHAPHSPSSDSPSKIPLL